MTTPHTESTGTPVPANNWLSLFQNTFIGLSSDSVILRVVGPIDIPDDTTPYAIEGLRWEEFVTTFAAEDACAGLFMLWAAVAEQRVAAEYCPAAVPFKPGIIATLRAIPDDPEIAYAVHLAPAIQYRLDEVLGAHTLDASKRLFQLSQNIFRGVHGPLTDPQVKVVGKIVALSEGLDQLLNNLRIAVTSPATHAPMPLTLAALLGFSDRDFSTVHRIVTHRLGLEVTVPDDIRVYCYQTMRVMLQRLLETLFAGLTARTSILLATEPHDAENIIHVTVSYHTQEPALQAETTLYPIDLFEIERFEPSSPLQRLLTSIHSTLSPINGRVWADPVQDDNDTTMRISLVLPRWRD